MNPRRVSLILVALNFGLIVALIYIILGMRTTPATGAGAGQTTYVTNTLTQIAVRKINATNLLASFGNRLINGERSRIGVDCPEVAVTQRAA